MDEKARTVELDLPFAGPWLAINSPARRVPSHGADLLGQTYAIDFVAVRPARRPGRWRTARVVDWRTVLATEPPERFWAFGLPVLAPADGTVVAVHDAEPDHVARRSPFTLLGYLAGQAGRLREGLTAITGNHVILQVDDAYVALVHLRRGSLRVAVGDRVLAGQQLAECGSSGNSTQPHVHVQAMDAADPTLARGLPVAFRSFRQWSRGAVTPLQRAAAVPDERSVVAQD